MKYTTFLKQFKSLVEQTTATYTQPNRQKNHGDYDSYIDFPYVDDDQTYVTHRTMEKTGIDDQDWGSDSRHASGTPPKPIKSIATEQETTEPAIKPDEKGAAAGSAEIPDVGEVGGDETLGADVSGGGVPGMDMGMGMGAEKEPELTSTEIGRVYELKKIYSRLSSVESYLSRATDQSVLELRRYVAQSIDLFEIVMANYPQFKEHVDDIIIQYYDFLDEIYSSLRKYHKDTRS